MNIGRKFTHSKDKKIDSAEKIIIDNLFIEGGSYYQKYLSWISIAEIKQHFRLIINNSSGKAKDVLESYINALAFATKAPIKTKIYWIDKTLNNEYLIKRYQEWWPNACFIFMVRDPRDVYSSYKKRDIKNSRSITPIDSFALGWANSIHAIQECRQTLPSNQYYLLRYEDLVQNPEEIMHTIAEFLQISHDPCLLNPSKADGRFPWGGNAENGKKIHGIVQSATKKYKQILDSKELSQIEYLLHREMIALNYSLTNEIKKYPSLGLRFYARKIYHNILNFGL
jgi:hypothetical protein